MAANVFLVPGRVLVTVVVLVWVRMIEVLSRTIFTEYQNVAKSFKNLKVLALFLN